MCIFSGFVFKFSGLALFYLTVHTQVKHSNLWNSCYCKETSVQCLEEFRLFFEHSPFHSFLKYYYEVLKVWDT